MLHESFIAATWNAPKLNASQSTALKDAGVFYHSFQPAPSLCSTFKKSAAAPNCIVLSPTHLFAAQSGKAAVHVYDRSNEAHQSGTNKHDTTIPFSEHIHSLALAGNGEILILGTESGCLLLWELCTGRLLSTPQTHLQPVNVLSVDLSENYVLSASSDSIVLVWSLLDILSFSPGVGPGTISGTESHKPRASLIGHNGSVTSVITGHSTSVANIAVSAAKDRKTLVWDYHSGQLLRSFSLHSVPLCLELDPADRFIYLGHEDGSTHRVDLYLAGKSLRSLDDPSNIASDQFIESSRWQLPPTTGTIAQTTTSQGSDIDLPENDSVLSLALSHDGTRLITGHSSGRILSWDSTAGRFLSVCAHYPSAPVTSLQFLPVVDVNPDGDQMSKRQQGRSLRVKGQSCVKPRPGEPYSNLAGTANRAVNGDYAFASAFPAALRDAKRLRSQRPSRNAVTTSDFENLLKVPGVAGDVSAECIAALSEYDLDLQTKSHSSDQAPSCAELNGDYLALEDQVDEREIKTGHAFSTKMTQEERIKSLNELLLKQDECITQLRNSMRSYKEREIKRKEKAKLQNPMISSDSQGFLDGSGAPIVLNGRHTQQAMASELNSKPHGHNDHSQGPVSALSALKSQRIHQSQLEDSSPSTNQFAPISAAIFAHHTQPDASPSTRLPNNFENANGVPGQLEARTDVHTSQEGPHDEDVMRKRRQQDIDAEIATRVFKRRRPGSKTRTYRSSPSPSASVSTSSSASGSSSEDAGDLPSPNEAE